MIENLREAQSGRQGMTVLETPTVSAPMEQTLADGRPRGLGTAFRHNSVVSMGRLLATSLVALVLPAYLTHKLPEKTYSAWVLILQLSAYVGYLDFGVQSGISKYVAEYEARNDGVGANQRASAGFAIMLLMGLCGVLMTLVLAWRVPHIFREMPLTLYRDVRVSLIFIGISLSYGLVCSVFSAIFLGLQRYAVPMSISVLNRVLFTGAVCAAIFFHSSLAIMGVAVACVNIATGTLQVLAWHKLARRIRVRLAGLDRGVLRKMLAYCSVLAIWSAGMLCVSGLDVTIVAKYDFSQTGFYSVAALPITFMIAIMGAALGPFLPMTSALSIHNTPAEMGNLLSRTTRYATIALLLSGLPLLVAGYPILRLWVGSEYALNSAGYLRLLVLANILRMLCAPYATMLVATESQKVAIAGAIAEAIVNVGSSIFLAKHMGAIGVAYGTLLGACVSITMHFAFNMHYTYLKFSVSRIQLFFNGVLGPAVMTIPSLVLVPLWWRSGAPLFGAPVWCDWVLSTLVLGWFVSINSEERKSLLRFAKRRIRLAARYNYPKQV